MQNLNLFLLSISILLLGACASQETPRDVSSVSTSNTKTLTKPKIIKSDKEGLSIRYAQMSMGFDANCNPNRIMSDNMNECAKLPENVKQMALDHCNNHDKNALFLGNKTSLLQMTISNFRCEDR